MQLNTVALKAMRQKAEKRRIIAIHDYKKNKSSLREAVALSSL